MEHTLWLISAEMVESDSLLLKHA